MTASRRPRPFSSRSFVQILLVTLVLRLPAPTDACDEIPRYVSMKPKGNPVAPVSAGFTAHYECRPGYRLIVPLVRPSVTVCQADGEWAPPLQEICTRKLCPHPGDPLNGRVEGSTQFGSQVNYFCNEGYILVGNSFLRCELSGNEVAWSGDPPQCNRHPTPDETPSKTLDACDEIPRYVSMKPKGNPVAPVDVGFTAHYECRPGYRLVIPLVRPTSTVCQADGTWAPPLREACKRKSCLHPEKPVNGRVEGSSQFGSRINYSCNEGYILVGNSFLRCKLYGNYVDWSDDPPQCNKILCKPPPQIQNGEFTKSYKDTFEYNEKVIYSCKLSNGSDPYSLVGNSTLRCSGPDKWNSDPPECKEVKCEFPSVTNGKIVSGFGTKFYYKAEVEFECNEGYSLEGRPKIVCEANAAWVPEKPRCVKVVTPPPPSTTTPILSPSGNS